MKERNTGETPVPQMIDERLEFQISQYADGSLPAEEVAALEATLDSDSEAAALLADYRKLNAVIKRDLPVPELNWDRLAAHLSDVVAEEDRATTVISISTWVRRVAVAAVVLIAVGTVVLWPRGNEQVAVAPTPEGKPVAVAVVEIGGPVVSTGPAVVEVAIGAPDQSQGGSFAVDEAIVYRPPRVAIASGMIERQDTARLPF